jgi:lipopolysaccharide export system permease protein
MANSFFPSRTISLYMARTFLLRSFAVVFALALVLQTLDLLGESGKILGVAGNDGGDVWRYVGLRLPQIIAFVLPFSVLLGTLITLATLNQNSEIIAMKASGLSAHQVLAPLVMASILVAIVSFAFNDRIVARASFALERWQKVEYGPLPPDGRAKINVWVRDGDNLIQAKSVTGRGSTTRLQGVTIYVRDGGALKTIITAPNGAPAENGWRIDKARGFDVALGTGSDLGTITVGSGIRPDQFTLADVEAESLSFGALAEAIGDLKDAGRPTAALEAGLWHKLAGPLSALLMPLLGAVAGFGIARSGQLVIRAVIGMALGFAYFVADNFGLAMGNLGAYPPLVAAWGPFLLFFLIGEYVLVKTEE